MAEKMKVILVRMPPEMHKRVKDYANSLRLPVAAAIRMVMQTHLARENKGKE